MSKIEFEPIGIIRSPYKEPKGVPIQSSDRADVKGKVELKPEYEEGLADLEGFSHLILLFHLHLSKGYSLRVVPFVDTERRGLFATRAPRRPNPIGLSVVRLERVEGTTLHVCGLDIVDGTPLLDIKPYVPKSIKPEDIRIGWLTDKTNGWETMKADGRLTS